MVEAMGNDAGKAHPMPVEVPGQTAAVSFTNNQAGDPNRGRRFVVMQQGSEVRDIWFLTDTSPAAAASRDPQFPEPRFRSYFEIGELVLRYLFPDDP